MCRDTLKTYNSPVNEVPRCFRIPGEQRCGELRLWLRGWGQHPSPGIVELKLELLSPLSYSSKDNKLIQMCCHFPSLGPQSGCHRWMQQEPFPLYVERPEKESRPSPIGCEKSHETAWLGEINPSVISDSFNILLIPTLESYLLIPLFPLACVCSEPFWILGSTVKSILP